MQAIEEEDVLSPEMLGGLGAPFLRGRGERERGWDQEEKMMETTIGM